MQSGLVRVAVGGCAAAATLVLDYFKQSSRALQKRYHVLLCVIKK
jgi:hypothetical protein